MEEAATDTEDLWQLRGGLLVVADTSDPTDPGKHPEESLRQKRSSGQYLTDEDSDSWFQSSRAGQEGKGQWE